jgi:hypothetical protein
MKTLETNEKKGLTIKDKLDIDKRVSQFGANKLK